jgi:hypothetical protein
MSAHATDVGAPTLTLREVTPGDEAFLFRVYADARREELACVAWTDDERHAFLASQFAAQYRYYREHYDGAAYHVVLAGGCLWRDHTRRSESWTSRS